MTSCLMPASIRMAEPCEALSRRVVMESRATAPIDGSASPRKPSVLMASKSPSGSLDVAWRSTASARSSALMPEPSSVTRIRRRPPSSITISMRVAPASIAFSTISLTADAGRSTTSPAAMRSIRIGSRRRMSMVGTGTRESSMDDREDRGAIALSIASHPFRTTDHRHEELAIPI